MDGQGPKEPTLPDHYAILGIPQYATMAHIKTAYRKMVLTHHPDKMAPGQTVDATDFRRVQEAYETLRDVSKRTNYDRQYQEIKSQWARYHQAMGRWQQKQSEREPQNLKQEWERQVPAEKFAAERSRREREQRRQRDREEREREEKQRKRAEKKRERAEKERLAEEAARRAAARAREKRWKELERAENERIAEGASQCVAERGEYRKRMIERYWAYEEAERLQEEAEAERLLREAEAESRTEVVLERARQQQAQRARDRLAAEREAEQEAERAAARTEGATKLAAAICLFCLAHSLLDLVVPRSRQ